MSYLVVYVGDEKFTPNVKSCISYGEGETYRLNNCHMETLRLARHFGITSVTQKSFTRIWIGREEKVGFFGGKKIVESYKFGCDSFFEDFESDLVYLEE
jgi:hypothetical protein